MRILVVQPTGDRMGHYSIYTVKLCQALGKLGHSVTLCTNRVYPERHISEPLAFTIHEVAGGRLAFAQYERHITGFTPYYWWGHFKTSFRERRCEIPITTPSIQNPSNVQFSFEVTKESTKI